MNDLEPPQGKYVPEGTRMAVLHGGPTRFYQITGEQIVEGKTYTLSAHVGRRKDNYVFAGYCMELLGAASVGASESGLQVLASDTVSAGIPAAGQWSRATLQFTATAAHAGQLLTIRMGSLTGTPHQTCIDHVLVTVH
jgi:hypothetical protein